jgi:hypothetical protein
MQFFQNKRKKMAELLDSMGPGFRRDDRMIDASENLNIQVRHIQGVLPDEVASRLHHVAHEFGEDVVGFVEFGNLDTQELRSTFVGVMRRNHGDFAALFKYLRT